MMPFQPPPLPDSCSMNVLPNSKTKKLKTLDDVNCPLMPSETLSKFNDASSEVTSEAMMMQVLDYVAIFPLQPLLFATNNRKTMHPKNLYDESANATTMLLQNYLYSDANSPRETAVKALVYYCDKCINNSIIKFLCLHFKCNENETFAAFL